MTIAASTIASNTADSGGGILNAGTIIVTSNSLVQANAAYDGGGIYNAGTVTIDASRVAYNRSTNNGGGFYNTYAGSTISVTGSSLLANGAANGGALYQDTGASSITGSCVVENSDTAVNRVGGTSPITATGNWWGHASGPAGAGPGVGDSVSSNVNFSGFLGAPILGCPTFADPDLAIAKTVTPTIGVPGGAITYTLSFSNTGARFTRSVVISDSIPLSVTITGVTNSTFGDGVFITQTSGSPNFAWAVSDLALGAGGYITLTGVISTDVGLVGTVITNTATMTAAADAAVANNSSSVSVTVADAATARCFATHNDGGTVSSSADASAVQQAVDAATPGATVKVAGSCVGVELRDLTLQSTYISKTLTLAGGYTTTNWTNSDPVGNPTVIDAAGGGRVLRIVDTVPVEIIGLTLQGGQFAGNGGGVLRNCLKSSSTS